MGKRTIERRASPRIPASDLIFIPEILVEGQKSAITVGNISTGGCFLESVSATVAKKEHFRFRIAFPDHLIEVHSKIIHRTKISARRYSIGVKFLEQTRMPREAK